MLAEEEAASEDGHQEDRTTQDEHLEHLEHLATEEQLVEGEDAQGVQDAQGNHAPEYEQLAMCIHDAPGGCWLLLRSSNTVHKSAPPMPRRSWRTTPHPG